MNRWLIIALVLLGSSLGAKAQVHLQAKVDTSRIRLGEPIHLSITATYPKNIEMLWPAWEDTIHQFSIIENNPTYRVLLPNGTYYAYAWAPGYNLQGAYVNENLTMKPFVVKGGKLTSSIDLTDWSPYPHSRGE